MAQVKEGEPGARERRSEERRRYWVRVVAEWRKSGLSQVRFCREREITVQTFRWWKSRLSQEGGGGRLRPRASRRSKKAPAGAPFVPVEVVGHTEPSAIELVCGGRKVRIHGDFEPLVLEKIVRTLEALAC